MKAKFDLGYIINMQPAFYLKAQRVALAADSKAAFDVDHFYEYGIRVLFDVSPYTTWFTNLAIDLNIHTGSVLAGGSIVFYIDEF
ncbi:Solitary outer membrane autotransporter beta-barrel domain [Pseudoalteromonas ulvae]|uniref:Solitary outer membrane autotransporter beta-barrel domain n=1 Tax=Pseudoalteromonas ulvae TaxID=107327 RepID=UPI0026BE9570